MRLLKHLRQHAANLNWSDPGSAPADDLEQAEQQADSVRLAAMRITSGGGERLFKANAPSLLAEGSIPDVDEAP